jgi:hypothetical protein
MKTPFLGYLFFLLGLVFLIEAIGMGYVLSQLAPLLGTIGFFAGIYALIKFVAGALCLYQGITLLKIKSKR